jgi:hypothetical protein
MKKILTIGLTSLLTISLSGCAFFDNEARDKAACDRLSDLLTAQGESSALPADAPKVLVDAIERDVLPLASGEFGVSIKDLIDSYRGLESRSIFDQFAGGLDTLYYSGLVLDRCVEISSSIPEPTT